MDENKSVVKVTVVIHTFNQEKFISECIKSVLSQDYLESMKLLIIDDASTDKTLEICENYQKSYPERIRISALSENELSQGLLVGLNEYLKIDTKYIAWCDGDDYWIDKSKIRKQVQYLEQNPSIGIVHTSYRILIQDSNVFQSVARSTKENEKSKTFEPQDLVNGNHIKQSTAMMINGALDFGFVGSARGIYACDWLMCASVAASKQILFLPEESAVVRVTKNGIWNGADHEENRRQKELVRWYCAYRLPDSELREAFRRRVILDWIRGQIVKSNAYRLIRPVIRLARRLK